jgi:hypothetical protein
VTARTSGCSISACTLPLPISSVVNTPSGSPASMKISSIASAQPGTFDECLSTATLPAIRAGAAKR